MRTRKPTQNTQGLKKYEADLAKYEAAIAKWGPADDEKVRNAKADMDTQLKASMEKLSPENLKKYRRRHLREYHG